MVAIEKEPGRFSAPNLFLIEPIMPRTRCLRSEVCMSRRFCGVLRIAHRSSWRVADRSTMPRRSYCGSSRSPALIAATDRLREGRTSGNDRTHRRSAKRVSSRRSNDCDCPPAVHKKGD
jgi:hypothetical protein